MKKLFTAIIFSAFAFNGFPQAPESKPLIKAGSKIISADEFLERYEFTPLFSKHIKSRTQTLKHVLAYSLAMEKLWALEAEEQGFGKSDAVEFASKEFERMFVRDALFHREIKNKVVITEDEIAEGYLKNLSTLEVNFLFSEDEEEIHNLYNLLNAGIPFDSILAESPELDEQPEPWKVVYGQMDKAVEDSLYELKLGEHTSPLHTPDGWYIFRLANRVNKMIGSERDKVDAYSSVRKIIEARKINKIYNEYFSEFFADKKIDVAASLFKSIGEKISHHLTEKKKLHYQKENELVYLEANELLKIEEEIGEDMLNMIFVKFEDRPVTVKQYLRALMFEGLSTKNASLNSIFGILNARTQEFIQQELLAREGIKKQMNLLPEVQDQLEQWRDNYLYQALRNKFIDSVSVTDEEALEYYKKQNQPENYPVTVNVSEILIDDAELLNSILNRLNEGEDFKALAAEFSQREIVKNNNGEYGFFSIHSNGIIGELAASMEIGDIYGPIKLSEGFSLIKLIDKKESYVNMPKPFEVIKEEIKNELASKKIKNKMTNYTVHLANKYGVEIDREALDAIEVTQLNSFGFRILGFGGKITAVPLLAPNPDWVGPWLQSRNLSQ